MSSLFLLALLPFALATSSPEASCNNGLYEVEGTGSFTTHKTYDFSTGDNYADDLHLSSYTVHDTSSNPKATHDHTFDPANVAFNAPYMELTVRGPTADGASVSSAEVQTIDQALYGSFRTTALLPSVPGAVVGFFSYADPGGEQDIEFLTDLNCDSNLPVNTGLATKQSVPPMQITNHPPDFNEDNAEHTTVASPGDAYTVEHEYRVDWSPGVSQYFIDGNLVATLKKTVPSVAESYLWNTWSNGDPGFSAGPPGQDATVRIRRIEMYYNSTSGGGGC